MAAELSFHPSLAAMQLTHLQKQIVFIMSKARRAVTQVEIYRKINTILSETNRSISQPTLSRAMSELVDIGIIGKNGKARDANFFVMPGADHFLKPAHLRPVARFDVERIVGYVPNKTKWLVGSSLERMQSAVSEAKTRHVYGAAASHRAAERFLIDLSWASSAMEGSTYEYLDTVALISYNEKTDGYAPIETTLILNHKRAIGFMMETIAAKKAITVDFIRRLHALLMRDLINDRELGTTRTSQVGITASSYRPSDDVRIIEASLTALVEKMGQIEDPCEASIFVLNAMSYLQAFTDGNKRTARLLANIPLLKAGYPPISFVDVDKRDYLAGLIAFYELGDLSLINRTVATAYETHACAYEAAIIAPNLTRTVEMRERRRIDNCISLIAHEIAGSVWSDDVIVSAVAANFADLSDDDQEIIVQSVRDTFGIIDPLNSCAWDIDPEIAEQIAKVRHLHSLGVRSQGVLMR